MLTDVFALTNTTHHINMCYVISVGEIFLAVTMANGFHQQKIF